MSTGNHFRHALRVATAAAAIACACGAIGGTESLVENSPFLPQSAVVQPGNSGALDRFELRGVASFGGTPTFSIYDTTNNRGYWIPLNGSEAGVRVASYDPATENVVLEGDGGSRRLFLKEAQIQTMAPPAPVPAGVAQQQQGAPLPAAAGAVTTEQEMAERRQRIIEELRRRRALRQQAQGQPAPQ